MISPFFNEGHESIRAMAKEFAEKSLGPVAMQIDRTDEFSENLVDTMVEMGFLGLKIPEEYGGVGMDMRTYTVTREEIAKRCPAAALYISSANSLSSAPIMLFGTQEQKQKYLPGVADNTAPVAFGLTEPGAGSDAGSVLTKAVPDGNDYILTGRKCFITFATKAKHTVIFAKTIVGVGVLTALGFVLTSLLSGSSVVMLYISYGLMTGLGIGAAYKMAYSLPSALGSQIKKACALAV